MAASLPTTCPLASIRYHNLVCVAKLCVSIDNIMPCMHPQHEGALYLKKKRKSTQFASTPFPAQCILLYERYIHITVDVCTSMAHLTQSASHSVRLRSPPHRMRICVH